MDVKGQNGDLDSCQIVKEAEAIKEFRGSNTKIQQKYKELLNFWKFASSSAEEKSIILFQICRTLHDDHDLRKVFFDLVELEYKFTRKSFIGQILRDLQSENVPGMQRLMAHTILATISDVKNSARKDVIFSDASQSQTILEMILPKLDLTQDTPQQLVVDMLKWTEIKAIKLHDFHMKLADLECEKEGGYSWRIVFVLLTYAAYKQVSQERLDILRAKCHENYFKHMGYDINADDLEDDVIQQFFGDWQDLVEYSLDNKKYPQYKYFDFSYLLKFLQKIADYHDVEYSRIVTDTVFSNFPAISDDDKFIILQKRDVVLDLSFLTQYMSESTGTEGDRNIGEFVKYFWGKSHDKLLTELAQIESADETYRLAFIAVKHIKDISPYKPQVNGNYFLFRFFLHYLADLSRRHNAPYEMDCDKGFGTRPKQSWGVAAEMQRHYLAYLKRSNYATNGKLFIANLPEDVSKLDKEFLRYLANQNLFSCFFSICQAFADMQHYSSMLESLSKEFLRADKKKFKYHYAFFIEKFIAGFDVEERNSAEFMQDLLEELSAACEQSEDQELRDASFARLQVIKQGAQPCIKMKFALMEVDIRRIEAILARENQRVADMAKDLVVAENVQQKIADTKTEEKAKEIIEISLLEEDKVENDIVQVTEEKEQVKTSAPKNNNQGDPEIKKAAEKRRKKKQKKNKSSQKKKEDMIFLLEDKLAKREDNFQNLFEYFKSKISVAEDLSSFEDNIKMAEKFLQAKLDLIALQGKEDIAEIDEFNCFTDQERQKILQKEEKYSNQNLETGHLEVTTIPEISKDEIDSVVEDNKLESEVAELNSSLDSAAIEKLLADKAELENQVALLEKKTASLKEDVSFQEELNCQLKRQNTELFESIDFLEKDNADLNAQLAAGKKLRKQKENLVGGYQSEEIKLKKMVSDLSAQLSKFKADLQSKEGFIKEMLDENKSLSNMVIKQRQEISAKEEQRKRELGDDKEASVRADVMRSQYLEFMNKELSNQVAQYLQKGMLLEKENHKLKKYKSEVQKNIASLQKKSVGKDSRINHQRKEIEILKNAKQKDNKDWEKLNRKLQQDLKHLRSEHCQLKRQVNLKEEITEQVNPDLNSLSTKELLSLLHEERTRAITQQQRSQNAYFLHRQELTKFIIMLVESAALTDQQAGYNMAVFDINTGGGANPSLFLDGKDFASAQYKSSYFEAYSSNVSRNFRDHVSNAIPDPDNSHLKRF